MKLMSYLAVTVAGAFLAVTAAEAQTNPTTAVTAPVREGQVVVPERPTLTDGGANPTADLRPNRPERPNLPPQVLSRIERFKLDARAYLAQQQALKKRLEGANDQDRAVLQERLGKLRDEWKERAVEMRKEYKDRQRELADKLPEYRELLDNLRSTAQQKAREAKEEDETRRGDP
jgi:uncharacterized protein YukE